MVRTVAILVVAAAAYGFSVGLAHDLLYAWRNLVKVPLLMLSTGGLCALAYFVVALFLGINRSFRRIQELSMNLFRDLTVLLASLVPVNLFLALMLRFTDDHGLGEYDLFLGLNVAFVAVSGSLALVRQAREVLRADAVSGRRASAVVGLWLGLTLLVGGQAAFYMRPMFGLPASRGQSPPWFLGAEPDVRGASNFYEMVLQAIQKPPLPQSW